jgi:hypothetical protein
MSPPLSVGKSDLDPLSQRVLTLSRKGFDDDSGAQMPLTEIIRQQGPSEAAGPLTEAGETGL